MKQRKFLRVMVCFLCLFCITACENGGYEKQEGAYPDFLTNRDWQYNTLSCTEILHFYENGEFSYYEACGNPIGNSDCYDTYSYDEDTSVITAHGDDDEEIIHSEDKPDKITTEFTELKREDIAVSVDSSFNYGYIWYNDNLEITKIVYYGATENWE